MPQQLGGLLVVLVSQARVGEQVTDPGIVEDLDGRAALEKILDVLGLAARQRAEQRSAVLTAMLVALQRLLSGWGQGR